MYIVSRCQARKAGGLRQTCVRAVTSMRWVWSAWVHRTLRALFHICVSCLLVFLFLIPKYFILPFPYHSGLLYILISNLFICFPDLNLIESYTSTHYHSTCHCFFTFTLPYKYDPNLLSLDSSTTALTKQAFVLVLYTATFLLSLFLSSLTTKYTMAVVSCEKTTRFSEFLASEDKVCFLFKGAEIDDDDDDDDDDVTVAPAA